MKKELEPRLTSLAHGGGCGCKIAPDLLQKILGELPVAPKHRELLVDASTSDDAAVYQISDDTAIVATTDFFMPIVDDPYDFGRIAATNALSDVLAMGARPIFSLALVGMPIGQLSVETISQILAGGRTASEAAGAPIAGGHSIDSVEPIYGLVALGVAHPDKVLRNSSAQVGDVLVLGKPLGVGIFSAALKKELLGEDGYAEMVASTTLLNTPGPELVDIPGVHAMTDVTGFGLLGHLSEMCRAADLSAQIHFDHVPVFETARGLLTSGVKTGASGRNWKSVEPMLSSTHGLNENQRDLLTDPQTSGGLLVSCTEEDAEGVLTTFGKHGHSNASVIGRMANGPAGIIVV